MSVRKKSTPFNEAALILAIISVLPLASPLLNFSGLSKRVISHCTCVELFINLPVVVSTQSLYEKAPCKFPMIPAQIVKGLIGFPSMSYHPKTSGALPTP